jgi:DcmR-like sensory protein
MEAQILTASTKAASKSACRFVIRQQPETAEVLQFVIGGIEIGQQVIALADPTWLKNLAASLNQKGIRSEALLRSSRLVFLTAPDCLTQLSKPAEALYHGVLHRNGSIVRWVTDWSWAYGNGSHPDAILKYQKRIHSHIRDLTAFSLCTVHCQHLERKSVLAMLVDHRRAAQGRHYDA